MESDVQIASPADAAAFIATIPGLEHAVMRRPGYTIEYDYVDPRELYPTLRSSLHPLAGAHQRGSSAVG